MKLLEKHLLKFIKNYWQNLYINFTILRNCTYIFVKTQNNFCNI